MNISDHITKADRIEATMRRKLDPAADYEIYVETFMLAGTHLLNAMLHAKGITKDSSDLLHSDKPKLDVAVPDDVAEVMAAMKFIEDLRPGYLRGKTPWRSEDGAKCLSNYGKVKEIAGRAIRSS